MSPLTGAVFLSLHSGMLAYLFKEWCKERNHFWGRLNYLSWPDADFFFFLENMGEGDPESPIPSSSST